MSVPGRQFSERGGRAAVRRYRHGRALRDAYVVGDAGGVTLPGAVAMMCTALPMRPPSRPGPQVPRTPMTIRYSVLPARPDAHEFAVRVHVPHADPDGQTIKLANWIPGSYTIRNFSRSVVSIDARGRRRGLSRDDAGSAPVALEKIDKSTWRAPPGLDALELELVVHAHEASVRTAWLDRHRAFFNGTSLFPYFPGREGEPVRVTLERPTHAEGGLWRVATTLAPERVGPDGFGEYRAADFDELIDHPVEMGELESVAFEACGVPHEMVLAGGGARFDAELLASDLARVCEHHVRFFGEPAPMPRYLFQVALSESGYGGLEHRASTALVASRESLPLPGSGSRAGDSGPERDDAYVTFLGLCSHEYFHIWNVKRIRPARFEPYRLERESHTRLLWFFEGVTSYYDDLALARAGLIRPERYLDLLGRQISRVRRGAGARVQSVADSSFDAWHKFYAPDANAPNAIVSYYAKGALVSLCLDAWMREASGGEVSLDTLMRTLWGRWLEGGAGLGEDGPERLVEALVGPEVAARLARALDATDELPLEAALAGFGVELGWRRRTGIADDAGPPKGAAADGCAGDRHEGRDADDAPPWLGARLVDGPAGAAFVHVFTDAPAERAGLAPGDTLVAVAGHRATAANVDALLRRHAGLDAVPVHAFRNGLLIETSLPLVPSPADTATLAIADRKALGRWLGADAA